MRKDKVKELLYQKRIYEQILKEKDDYLEVLICLGEIYTYLGEYRKSLKVDLKISEIIPDQPHVYYNLACDYSLLGNIEEAFKNLKIAFSLGYKDFDSIDKDPDLENLRKDKRYKNFKKRYFR